MKQPKTLRFALSLAVLAVLLAGLLPDFLAAAPQEASPHPRIVWVGYGEASLETLQRLAAALDIWEDRPEEHKFLALVSPEEEAWLRAQGYQVEVVRVLNPTLDNPLDPRYYYYDSDYTNPLNRYVVDFLNEVNNTYPDIVELIDIGDAWETDHGGHHRDIWVMRITNEDPAYGPISEKPPFFLFANIHAREVATPELAMRYIRYLTSGYNGLGGYGIDPDVTWLVDWNVVYVEVMQNPDGHRVNEQYSLDAYRRKNMDNDDGCTNPSTWGVDLNRNHNFMWGIDDNGSSPYPCYETYRGPSPGSEPETLAFQNFISTTVFRDQNGPNGDYEVPPAAPVTTTGIFISLHSYSDYVLWPWGYTYNLSPNDAGMRKIGRKFAYYNGYNPIQHIWYYVNGPTDDWTYGKFGVPSYTFEVGYPGSDCGDDWFFFDYECIDGDQTHRSLWNENRPAFLYAHKIARTPYLTAYGPDAQNLLVTPDPVPQGQPVSLSALIQDHRCCGDTPENIGGAEYFIDQPGQDGTGIPMSPQDGSWGGASETALATVDTSGLTPGRHYILVHGKSTTNYWGPFTAVFLTVTPPAQCEPVEILDVSTTAAGCTVTFTASLTGTSPFTYAWDFGPFGSSSQPTPTVAFGTPGTYPYTLTVSNCYGQYSDTFSGTVAVDCCLPPENAAFAYAPSLPVAGETTVFTGTAESNRPLSFSWDFGDGTLGSGNPVSHTYASSGNYTVRMTATNECGATFAQGTLSVCGPASGASFTWTPADPVVGQWVYFHAQASGTPPLAYAWDFGDGGHGSGANASHRYNQAGEYTVVLTVTNACGRQVVSHRLTVWPSPPICDPVHNAAFSWEPASPYAGQVVTFTGSAEGDTPIVYAWDFGDGSQGSGSPAAHTYAASGTYTVVMTATNCGTHTAVAAHDVRVLAPGVCVPAHDAAISFSPESPLIFQPVLFTATVAGDAPFTYTWALGDGAYGYGNPLTHIYLLPGPYTVVLTVTNCGGSGLSTATRLLEVGAYRIYLPLVMRGGSFRVRGGH